jgi:hypothetical protein
MNASAIAEFVSAVVLIIGVIFAIVQIRHFRVARDREAALELVHSTQTKEFTRALYLVLALPDGLSKAEIEQRVGDDMGLVYSLMATCESLGILVFKGEVDLDLVTDFFCGPILIAWRKLEGFVSDQRAEFSRDRAAEWFQWLAERIQERESTRPTEPAYMAHKGWKPKR